MFLTTASQKRKIKGTKHVFCEAFEKTDGLHGLEGYKKARPLIVSNLDSLIFFSGICYSQAIFLMILDQLRILSQIQILSQFQILNQDGFNYYKNTFAIHFNMFQPNKEPNSI